MFLIMMKTGKCLGNEVDVCKDFNMPLTERAADFDTIFKALEVGGGSTELEAVHVAGVGKIGLHLEESQSVGKEPCALECNVDALCCSGDDKNQCR